MQSQGVFSEQPGSDQMLQEALQDEVVRNLLKYGDQVTQEAYLALAYPEENLEQSPEIAVGLPSFFHHLSKTETSPKTPLSEQLFERHSVQTTDSPQTVELAGLDQLLPQK